MEHLWRRLSSRFADTETTSDDFPPEVLYAKDDEDVGMAAYYIRSKRFGRRLFGGLEPEEVAAFLDEVAEALLTAQRREVELASQVRVLEEQVQTLSTTHGPPSDRLPGVEQQALSITRPTDETEDARAASRLEGLRSTALQEVEALLHDAQARAKALTDAADERAAEILRAARDEEASLRHELDRLAESRLRMLDDVWGTLNGCQEWLATVDPRRQRAEERKDRVA
jgi:DivIVA domain-containing protein